MRLFEHAPLFIALTCGVVAISVGSCMRAGQAPALTLGALIGEHDIGAVEVRLSLPQPILAGSAKLAVSTHWIFHKKTPSFFIVYIMILSCGSYFDKKRLYFRV